MIEKLSFSGLAIVCFLVGTLFLWKNRNGGLSLFNYAYKGSNALETIPWLIYIFRGASIFLGIMLILVGYGLAHIALTGEGL